MKKRGALLVVLALALAASLAALSACGQSSPTQSGTNESLDASTEPTMSEEPVILKTEPFYVLVVGSDSREGTVGMHGQYADGKGRSDTIMLVRVDPTTYKLTVVTIPRDTTIDLDGQPNKINESFHQGGIDGLIGEVKSLTGVTPDYYMITTFVNFQKIINDMGGLDVVTPLAVSAIDALTGDTMGFEQGEQTLDGAQALIFARDRHSYDMSGNAEPYRQFNDRYIFQTMLEQILAKPDNAGDVATQLYPYVETNLSDRELAAYVQDFADNAKKVSFELYTGPNDGGVNEEVNLWLAYRDEETWAKIIDAIESGKDASEIVPNVNPFEFAGSTVEVEGTNGSTAEYDNYDGESAE